MILFYFSLKQYFITIDIYLVNERSNKFFATLAELLSRIVFGPYYNIGKLLESDHRRITCKSQNH